MNNYAYNAHPEKTYKLNIGNLETVRVVISVNDVVDAYYKLMICEKSNGQIFNVCGDTPLKMSYFTDKLIELSGLNNIEKVIDGNLYRKHDIFYQHGSTEKIKLFIDWEPKEKIDDTLRDLLNYWIKKQS